jgi:hypothetical protein
MALHRQQSHSQRDPTIEAGWVGLESLPTQLHGLFVPTLGDQDFGLVGEVFLHLEGNDMLLFENESIDVGIDAAVSGPLLTQTEGCGNLSVLKGFI